MIFVSGTPRVKLTYHFALRKHVQVRADASNGNGAKAANADGAHEYDYDLFTIGAGSGGTRASRVSASQYGVLVRFKSSFFKKKGSAAISKTWP